MPIISVMSLKGVSEFPHQNTERSMQRSEKKIFTVCAGHEAGRNPEYPDAGVFLHFSADYAAYGSSYVYEIFHVIQAGNY